LCAFSFLHHSSLEKMKIFAFLAGLQVAFGQAPIPNRPVGFVYNPTGNQFVENPVEVQVFIDLQCPSKIWFVWTLWIVFLDCLSAWPGLKAMGDHYGPNVRLSVVAFPLPYHRAAFKMAWGLQAVNKMNPQLAYDYMDNIFANVIVFFIYFFSWSCFKQDDIANYAAGVNDKDLVQYIANKTVDKLNINKDTFLDNMADPNLDWATRVDWKFACSLGVSGFYHRRWYVFLSIQELQCRSLIEYSWIKEWRNLPSLTGQKSSTPSSDKNSSKMTLFKRPSLAIKRDLLYDVKINLILRHFGCRYQLDFALRTAMKTSLADKKRDFMFCFLLDYFLK